MRSLLAAALLCAPLAIPAPASAAPGVFAGSLHIVCFGCGTSQASASLTFVPGGFVGGEFTVQSPASSTCALAWSFVGYVDGGRRASVNVTVVGAVMVITAIGDFVVGAGVVAITSPIGNPCGGPVDAIVAGAVV